jgi:hypothetical protein
MDRKETNREIVIEYASSNAVTASNLYPLCWCLDAWALGCDGVLPWQTVGNADSWKKGDELSLFYPGPIPSIRLKAYRRGQQDVEYLTLLSQVLKEPRWALSRSIREAQPLVASGEAGGRDYGRVLPQDVWKLRAQIGSALSSARPEPRRKLIDQGKFSR